ncbi:TBC1 domain family member 23 [Holothuria leucospilota]|uniref:TBC1 domain family member 23 n=1 Tax=Holothuria leucospilota TaxID=206669 RepID=A0A9Q1BXA8_HOLLE|nr:TBC1 domain family member 23 [Holothuria leucospilota]
MVDSDTEDTSWHEELAAALLEKCDFGRLRNICNGRQIPQKFQAQAWKICLNVSNKADSLSSFDGIFDLPEQAQLRKDCKEFIDKFDNSDEEKLSLASDLESVITFYCKSKNVKYETSNGWLDILGPLVAHRMERSDLYNCFYALITKYVPRDTQKESASFQLFRLLLMYHEPDMCNFLDTRKIFPHAYSSTWFSSIFASSCGLDVTQPFWTLYLLQADPFLTFFLGVVILVNAKEHVQSLESSTNPEEIAECLASFPSQLEVDDISDFFSLAQYYASKTPQSFRRDYQAIFTNNIGGSTEPIEQLEMALCLQVNPAELFQAILQGTGENVSYFVVDCRPADQYNKSHLATAFHLDANLMLQQPLEFASAVKALFTAQKQAIDAESQAAGEHLCFLGSGREEEDQYLHMVVANFLQKKTQYVSIVSGGYTALLKLLEKESEHILKSCIVTQPDAASSDDSGTFSLSSQLGDSPQKLSEKGAALMGRFTNTLRTKGGIMKEKVVEFIKNEGIEEDRHVSSEDTGKRYRGSSMQPVFTIADDEDEGDNLSGSMSSDEERRELVNTEVWLSKPDVIKSFECQEVKDNGHTYPGHILLTASHMYVLREAKDRKNFSYIMARRPLREVVRITSKKRCTELITFRYGRVNKNNETIVYAIDRLYLPEAPEATKLIKQQIVTCIEGPEAIRKLDRREEQALAEEQKKKENRTVTPEVEVAKSVENEADVIAEEKEGTTEEAEEVTETTPDSIENDSEGVKNEES